MCGMLRALIRSGSCLLRGCPSKRDSHQMDPAGVSHILDRRRNGALSMPPRHNRKLADPLDGESVFGMPSLDVYPLVFSQSFPSTRSSVFCIYTWSGNGWLVTSSRLFLAWSPNPSISHFQPSGRWRRCVMYLSEKTCSKVGRLWDSQLLLQALVSRAS